MISKPMEIVMAGLDREIAAFDTMRADLENRCMGKWVVIHERKLISVFQSFDEAAEVAVREFGRGPYLIRQVGAPPITLPGQVTANPVLQARRTRLGV
jgi:hypothetical protein